MDEFSRSYDEERRKLIINSLEKIKKQKLEDKTYDSTHDRLHSNTPNKDLMIFEKSMWDKKHKMKELLSRKMEFSR